MIGCVYVHPSRTLLALWDTSSGKPTLRTYKEYPPAGGDLSIQLWEALRSAIPVATPVRVILHGTDVHYHRYPVEPDEDLALRRTFEMATCMPDANTDADMQWDIELPAQVHGSTWRGVLVARAGLIRQWRDLSPGCTQLVPDILADAACLAQPGIAAPAGTTAFVVCRGNRWWCCITSPNGTIQHLACMPSYGESWTENVRETVMDHIAAMDTTVERVIMAGEGLTPHDIRTATLELEAVCSSVQRHMPFRLVRSAVEPDVASECLRRAHVIGPLVGALFL